MALKDRGTEALWEIQRRFRRHLRPPDMEGPSSLGIWRVTGWLGSQSRPGHALLLRAAPTDCKQSSQCLSPRPQRRALPRTASRSPGTQAAWGQTHASGSPWLGAHPPWVPACSAPEAGITVPASQARRQPHRPGAGLLQLRLGKWSKPSQLLSPDPGSPGRSRRQRGSGVPEGGGSVPSSPCPGGGHGRPHGAFAFTGTEGSPRQDLFVTPGLAPRSGSQPSSLLGAEAAGLTAGAVAPGREAISAGSPISPHFQIRTQRDPKGMPFSGRTSGPEGREGEQGPWGEVGQGALARMEEPIGRGCKGQGPEARWWWDPAGGWQRRLCCRGTWHHHRSPAWGVTWARRDAARCVSSSLPSAGGTIATGPRASVANALWGPEVPVPPRGAHMMSWGCLLTAFQGAALHAHRQGTAIWGEEASPRFPRYLTPQTQGFSTFQWAAGLDAARALCFLQDPS